MKIRVIEVADRGDAATERLWLRVTQDTNLALYVVVLSMASPEPVKPPALFGVEAGAKSAYWFGSLNVASGDSVMLYSRAGQNSSEPRGDGKTNHFIFWGFAGPVWADPNAVAVIFEVSGYESTHPIIPAPTALI